MIMAPKHTMLYIYIYICVCVCVCDNDLSVKAVLISKVFPVNVKAERYQNISQV